MAQLAEPHPTEAKAEFLELLTERDRRQRARKLLSYEPYPKQLVFHAAGLEHRERLFMAGNQLGKTVAGAAEMAMHLTGRYPDWWEGRRFNLPVAAIVGSETAEVTRRGAQRLLIGPPEDESQWGTGFIPGDDIVDTQRKRGVPDALDSVVVKHVSGGNSTAGFKSYDQGRAKWQADTVHLVWFDEEPPLDVFTEGMTRTNATNGMVYITFTPLLGMSGVVHRFLSEESPDRHVTNMTIDDAPHIAEKERDRIVASYPEFEREARARGTPSLGSGRIFPVPEEAIVCDSFTIPAHFAQLVGIDFGYEHPFAAVRCAWDRDADIFYVCHAYKERLLTPPMHAATIRRWGDWIPIAWPQDGLQHGKSDGVPLAEQYREQGLSMLEDWAAHEAGGNSVEAGLIEMLERMQTGRFKVFRGNEDWLNEFRLYHRKNGVVFKERDDLMDATRYAVMMRREAKVEARPLRSMVHGKHAWMG